MIKANEVRLTNLVGYNGSFHTVAELFNISNNTQWNPIPLTEEWMINFGFINSGFSYEMKTEKFEMSFLYYDDWHFNYKDNFSDYSTVTFYNVHEFQNLYFALTGEELTLKN